MNTYRFLTGSPALIFLLALAACGGGAGGGSQTRESAAIGTFAYVVTDCHEDATGFSLSQRLQVVRGDGAPATVMEIPTYGRLPALGLCPLFGALGEGRYSVFAGAFQRLGVSRDGSSVVFEVNFEFSILTTLGVRNPLTAEQEGIFYVRADGTGLRKLGPPSREPAQRLGGIPTASMAPTFYLSPYVQPSPDGRTFTFIDRGPGPAGEDAAQVVIVDLATGRRLQVTQLPDVPPDPSAPAVTYSGFQDDATIYFFSRANPADPSGKDPTGLNPEGQFRYFTVKTDGTDLTVRQLPILRGGGLDPSFRITGSLAGTDAVSLSVRGTPVNPAPFFPPGSQTISEVFVLSADHSLQLTTFGRTDTGSGPTDGRRVFVTASADPFGTNPSENCQIFSLDALGADLRQLTHFRAADHSTIGCLAAR